MNWLDICALDEINPLGSRIVAVDDVSTATLPEFAVRWSSRVDDGATTMSLRVLVE